MVSALQLRKTYMNNLYEHSRIYLAAKNRDERSRMEDLLVLDGFDVSTFDSASRLWTRFQDRPTRMIFTDRRFANDMSGLDLARKIRETHLMPYVYIVILSALNQFGEIKQALAAGVDDYIVKPHNKLQIRSRTLVGRRWLAYIDMLNPTVENNRRESNISGAVRENGILKRKETTWQKET